MTIRVATVADRTRLIEMAAAFLAHTPYGALLPTNLEALGRLVDIVLELGVILVAEGRDGDLVGMIGLAEVPHLVTGEHYVEEMAWWVDPPFRSGTVGPRLLTAGEEWVKSRNLSLLRMVAPAGSRVGPFYERMGYTAVESTYCKRL